MTKIDPNGIHLTAYSVPQALEVLQRYHVSVVFLDIEMPGINGIEAAECFAELSTELNIIFVTGHPEYSFEAHGLHPSGFLTKPVSEEDIRHELDHLRFPQNLEKSPLVVQCTPFALFANGQPFAFSRDRTIELFAYLIYREGAFCTNGELLGVLWDGDPDKQGYLRQLVLDMRRGLMEIGAENVVIKKYGRLSADMRAICCKGDPSRIIEEYCWLL